VFLVKAVLGIQGDSLDMTEHLEKPISPKQWDLLKDALDRRVEDRVRKLYCLLFDACYLVLSTVCYLLYDVC
jgi:hypothetical protein